MTGIAHAYSIALCGPVLALLLDSSACRAAPACDVVISGVDKLATNWTGASMARTSSLAAGMVNRSTSGRKKVSTALLRCVRASDPQFARAHSHVFRTLRQLTSISTWGAFQPRHE